MTGEDMIDQAQDTAEDLGLGTAATLLAERNLLRDIIRHLCDPEQHPYPMTSPEL